MKLLYRIYQLLVLLPVTVLASIFFGLSATVFSPLGNRRWGLRCGNWAGRWWGKTLVRATLLPVKVTGRENLRDGESYVLLANHQGCYDIFLMFGYINVPICWMMKASLRKVPFIGSACENSGQIFVDNSGPHKIKASYEKARDVLKDGVNLAVFPEGRRTFTGKMSPFKRGAFLLAHDLQLPVVPVTINGPFHVMPRTRDFHFANWAPLSLTIHKPIYPDNESYPDVNALMTKVREEIQCDLEPQFRDK